MTLPNSSPALGENIKSAFARLAENIEWISRQEEDEMIDGADELAARCHAAADGVPPRSEQAEQEHRERVDYGMRMARQRNDLLAVLFSPEETRRELFDWLCGHSDVPEIYRNDYARP